MTDQELMQSIKKQFAGEISDAAMNSNVPAPFLAALIANESGGDPLAKRFEGSVLVSLWKVLLGRTPAFGVFHGPDLLKFVAGLTPPQDSASQSVAADAFQRLDSLATSWGLTQIMGYHCLEKNSRSPNYPVGLQLPARSLVETVRLLNEFAERFQLDVTQDFDSLFRCWNGGHPDAATFDPNYSKNGAVRLAIYAGLP